MRLRALFRPLATYTPQADAIGIEDVLEEAGARNIEYSLVNIEEVEHHEFTFDFPAAGPEEFDASVYWDDGCGPVSVDPVG